MPKVDDYLRNFVILEGSDLHLSGGARPRVRVNGDMQTIENERLPAEASARLIEEIMTSDVLATFRTRNDADFAYDAPGIGRFRVNAFLDRRGVSAVFRHVPSEIPTFKSLGLPSVIESFTRLSRGLVLVTGPTGSGKSTTLAAIVDGINRTLNGHIITIEDPIEFVYENERSLVNQREVGLHTESFAGGLRAALREDPDVILVGEMRDLLTTSMAIEAAETGHLVLATLHTSSAHSTVDRIIDQFPGDQQAQIRTMLAMSLKAVVSQSLLQRADKSGRVAALEIMVMNRAISSLIREGKTHQISSCIQTGGRHGMVMLNDSILKLVSRGIVDPREGYLKSSDKDALLQGYKVASVPFAVADSQLPAEAATKRQTRPIGRRAQ